MLLLGLGEQCGFDTPTQHHHAPRPAPAGEPQLGLYRVEALAYRLPVMTRPLSLDQALDPGALAQLEQVALPDLFHLGHHRLITKGIVAAY